jgi:hypothetical protein
MDKIKKPYLNSLICIQKLKIYIEPYYFDTLKQKEKHIPNAECITINNNRMEIFTGKNLETEGILRVYLFIPKYWDIKKQIVNHHYIYTPQEIKLIGKVKNKYLYSETKLIFFNIDIVAADPVDDLVIKKFIKSQQKFKLS